MAIYTWNITNQEVLEAGGHPTPTTPSLPSNTALGKFVKRYSSLVNLSLRGIGVDPATVTTTSNDELYQACREMIIARTYAEWDRQNQHEQSYADAVADFKEFREQLKTQPGHMTGVSGHDTNPRTGPARTATGQLVNARRPPGWITEDGGFQ